MFGSRKGKPVTVTVKSYGEDLTISMRPLSALDADAIRNAYPPPTAPKKEVDGKTVSDDNDPDHYRAMIAWLHMYAALKLCRMIGSDQFGTENPIEQIALLKADFTEGEFSDLVREANRVNNCEITPQTMEAAKERLAPFASGSEPSA